MVNVLDFHGKNDSERINKAIRERDSDGIVVIPPRKSETEPERKFWLLDEAILLPSDTTVILENCKLKLSDKCRDNFFRTANCGFGFPYPEKTENVHIKGVGLCVLEGADHPRSTGDGTKIIACPCPKTKEDLCRYADWIPEERKSPEKLDFWDEHNHSYGTDALIETESHMGDWRNIGILFARAEHCSIENLRIVCTHGWGISWEDCSEGYIRNIDFDSCMAKEIDGMLMNMENQDGIDLRNGCHDIVISDITGGSGDDLIALTAIADDVIRLGGELAQTHVMHSDWSKRERDIHDVIIRNVIGYSKGHICFHVRLLPAECKIYNVVIDGVIDNSPEGFFAGGVLLLGDGGGYGRNPEDGMKNISISNIVCNSSDGVMVCSYLNDSVITNVTNRNPNCPAVHVFRPDGLRNVKMCNIVSASGEDVRIEKN